MKEEMKDKIMHLANKYVESIAPSDPNFDYSELSIEHESFIAGAEAVVKLFDLADVGDCVAFRICEHCNKEYKLSLTLSEDKTVAVNNHQTCPHCKERDDAWIKIKKKQH